MTESADEFYRRRAEEKRQRRRQRNLYLMDCQAHPPEWSRRERKRRVQAGQKLYMGRWHYLRGTWWYPVGGVMPRTTKTGGER